MLVVVSKRTFRRHMKFAIGVFFIILLHLSPRAFDIMSIFYFFYCENGNSPFSECFKKKFCYVTNLESNFYVP